jgi:muramoyltetrapeptide carboxypeptidase
MRAEEFMTYATREDINAIICGRGGYGAMRLLPMLDFKLIQDNPKIIIGFSDITALINAIQLKTGIITFHGPTASSSFNEFNTAYFKKILAPGKDFKPVRITSSDIEIINKGTAEGPLVGGNLSIITGTLGTPYEIDTRGAILFIEETREQPYKIDRMLTQLWLAGKLQQASGIIYGKFTNLDAQKHFFPGMSYTVRQILEERTKPLNVPAIHSAPIGHEKYNATIPISIMATLDADHKQIIISSPAVSL